MEYDIAIIGGGPAGYTAAERASENGLKTILFEKNAIGGVCLNEGCIPTKTLLYSAKILDSIKSASKYGIVAMKDPSFDLAKIIDRKNKTVRKLTLGVKARLTGNGVTIVEGEARITGEEFGNIRIHCDGKEYLVKNVLVCTGSETVIPPIKGLSEVKYWTSREALDLNDLPKSLAIIGGGVIGMEFASFFNSMGVKVKVIEMLPEILGNMDKETSAMLRSEYKKKGVEFCHVGRRTLEPGQYVQAGQTISYLVRDKDKWITANYKETQIPHIYIGQKVRIKVDALPGKIFNGEVTAISDATGSKYSLVPTDNSAGNFVKVQQRIPVRIDLENLSQEDTQYLRAGMMVETEALRK